MHETSSHYEVLGRQSSSWIVQRVCDDKKSAIESASSLFKELSLKAVKVLKVSYEGEEPGFKDKEVFFEGEREPANSKQTDIELIKPICQQASDLYRLESRRAIYNLLKNPLNGWKIVPLELLYHAENLQRLNDAGQVLQGAVQKVAISQIPKTGQKVSERVLDLYSLTNEILRDLKVQRQKDDFILVTDENLEELFEEAKQADDVDIAFMTAFCRFLRPIDTLDLKFEKILQLIADNDDLDVLGFLDKFLADFLNLTDRLKQLIGDSENLGEGILRILDFALGQAKPSDDCHSAFARINELLQRKQLPQTQRALIHKVKTTIKGNASFVKNDPFKSILYHKRILNRMALKDGSHIGGQDCADALKERCAKMTGSTSIAEFLNGFDTPLDRVGRLIDIASGVIGSSNMRTIANYILPVLENPFNIGQMLDSREDDLKTLKKIAAMQTKVRRAGFQDFFANRMALQLDKIGAELYAKKDVEGQLIAASTDTVKLGLQLLRVVSEGEVSEPEVTTKIRTFAKVTIMSKEFMLALKEHASKGDANTSVLKEFTLLLQRTRIDR